MKLMHHARAGRGSRIRFAILAALLLVPVPGIAQQANPLSLTVGDKVRLREPGRTDVVTATVADVTAESFSFFVEGEPGMVLMPYVNVDTITVRRRIPRKSAVSSGFWGMFLGATAGAITGPFAAPSMSLDTGPAMAAFTVGGGTVGAVIGGAIGALVFPNRWYRHVLR